MDWLRQNIIPVLMVLATIGATYTKVHADIATMDQRLDATESSIQSREIYLDKVIKLETISETNEKDINGLATGISEMGSRISKAEITSAETVKVLEAVTTAVSEQTVATTELTKQVIRLESKTR